jgi:cyclopropane-fatty-acyl-phospholipid synthase
MNSVVSPLFSLVTRLSQLRFLNTISNTRSNISAHYDISNSMFEGIRFIISSILIVTLVAFLSEDMTYSCAIFEDLDADVKKGCLDSLMSEPATVFAKPVASRTPPPPYSPSLGQDELHDAQIRKLMHILTKADVRQSHRVLEIGSGWGSFAILAVQLTGCTVDTITLSQQQQEFARRRITALGLEDHIRVHLMDYRNMPSEWKGQFDRIVSIEMLEAVGQEFLPEYFKVVDWALKPEGGVAVIQSITIPEARKCFLVR